MNFRILNQGDGEAGPAVHEIRLVGVGVTGAEVAIQLATVETGPLGPGVAQPVSMPIMIPPRGFELQNPRIRVIADINQDVEETNEENNSAEFSIQIGR